MIDPLIVDAYAGDQLAPTSFSDLSLAGKPWCGGIYKATQGTTYVTPSFSLYWQALKATSRYALDWFRGAYHYLDVISDASSANATRQAELYLTTIDAAGGWGSGDLWPIVDVEAGGGNEGATAAQVEDCTNAYANWIFHRTDRAPMLYGGSFLRDLGINNKMGCGLLWTPRYSATLPASAYEDLGFTLADTWGWQYVGAPSGGSPTPPLYPSTTPIGQLDTTAIIINGGADPAAAIEWTRTHLWSNP